MAGTVKTRLICKPVMEKKPVKRLILCLAAFALAACLPAGIFSAFTTNLTPSPDCTPAAMPTGERIYPFVFDDALPAQVTAGQSYRVRFTGGLMLLSTGMYCGGQLTVYPVMPGTAEATNRLVFVKLDDLALYSGTCGYDCTLAFTIPPDFPPGSHEFILKSMLSQEGFPVEVLPGAP
jgi:hypothetical protein